MIAQTTTLRDKFFSDFCQTKWKLLRKCSMVCSLIRKKSHRQKFARIWKLAKLKDVSDWKKTIITCRLATTNSIGYNSYQYTHAFAVFVTYHIRVSFILFRKKLQLSVVFPFYFFFSQIKPHWCSTSRSSKFDQEFGCGVDTKWNKNQLCSSSKFYEIWIEKIPLNLPCMGGTA